MINYEQVLSNMCGLKKKCAATTVYKTARQCADIINKCDNTLSATYMCTWNVKTDFKEAESQEITVR